MRQMAVLSVLHHTLGTDTHYAKYLKLIPISTKKKINSLLMSSTSMHKNQHLKRSKVPLPKIVIDSVSLDGV